jgi:hypothetical protein
MTGVAHGRARLRYAHAWPLLVILAVQAALSLRLVWSNTAFEDEALYLWAGHQEFAHWFFGTPIPAFPSWFSGAPVIYPPLAAMADSIGGLAAARLLSLAFMLGATALLWSTAGRLYGRRAALAATALWALLGPVIRLGAFATYDAMALACVALAAWFATGQRGRLDATRSMVWAAVALTLGNATKYATLAFDPAVIALAVASGFPAPGGKHAWRRGALLFYWVALATIGLLEIGQDQYLQGIDTTTLERPGGEVAIATIMGSSLAWTGLVLALAAVSLLAAWRDRVNRPLVMVLVGTGLFVPLWQARIHTLTSLNKHVAFGAWFAAIAVGYGADRAIAWVRARAARSRRAAAQRREIAARWGTGTPLRPVPRLVPAVASIVPLALLVPLGSTGLRQAESFYTWPGVGNLVPLLREATVPGGHYLAQATTPLEYYLPRIGWRQWTSMNAHPALAKAGLEHHAYTLVILNADDRVTVPGYRMIATVPYSGPDSRGAYRIWEYERG